MSAPSSIDLSRWLSGQLSQASSDLLRAMLSSFVQALMGAEADAVCGAEYGMRSSERTNTRNGYRIGNGTRGRARSSWLSPSSGQGRTSRTGCWSGAAGRRPPWDRPAPPGNLNRRLVWIRGATA